MYHTRGNEKKAGVAILISDKLDFKTKTVTGVPSPLLALS